MPSRSRALPASQPGSRPAGRPRTGASGVARRIRAAAARACQRIRNAVLAIGVLCLAGATSPLHAELIDDPLGEKSAADPAAGSAWSEDPAQPARDSADSAGDRDRPADARPAPLLPIDEAGAALPARARRAEKHPARAQTREFPVPAAATGPASADLTLAPELKEAIRPIYESLSTSAIAEEMRELKAEIGPIWAAPAGDAAVREISPDTGNRPADSASWEHPAAAPRSAAQMEKDKLVASIMLKELIDEIKPWAIGLVGLYLVGYLVKLWLEYVQRMAARKAARKAARSAQRGSRHSRHHRRAPAAAGSPPPRPAVAEALPGEPPPAQPAADA